jgi:hypothetical protein
MRSFRAQSSSGAHGHVVIWNLIHLIIDYNERSRMLGKDLVTLETFTKTTLIGWSQENLLYVPINRQIESRVSLFVKIIRLACHLYPSVLTFVSLLKSPDSVRLGPPGKLEGENQEFRELR